MKETMQRLSKREWDLMGVCWKKKKLTVNDVIDNSPDENKRNYQTVKSQLEVLIKKDYLYREKFGPLWLYSPKITPKDAIINEIDYFICNIANDYLFPIFIHLVNTKKIKPDELKELKKIINDMPDD